MVEHKKIISLNISVLKYKEALTTIIELAKTKVSGYICFANVHMTIEAYKSESFANNVNKAKLVLPDGMPLVKALHSFYKIKQERIAGMDVFPELLELSALNGLKVFFYGTTPELLLKITERAKKEFPNITIVGALAPPFSRSVDDEEFIQQILKSEANIVFVALGCPKQENWMANHSAKINAILLGVGGAFPIYAKTAKRAPAIFQKLSLEWLYRLMQEPKRLFKRYFLTNNLFLYLVFKEKAKKVFIRQ